MLVVSFFSPTVFTNSEKSFIEYDQFSVAGGSVNFHILPLKLHGGVMCILGPTLSSALPVGSNEPNFKMY